MEGDFPLVPIHPLLVKKVASLYKTAKNASGHGSLTTISEEKKRVSPLPREDYVSICERQWRPVPVFARRKRHCRDVRRSKWLVYLLRSQEDMHEEDGGVPWYNESKVTEQWKTFEWERFMSYGTDKSRFECARTIVV